jgi:hypothetical protein
MKISTKKLIASALVMALSGGVYAQAGGGAGAGGAGGGGAGAGGAGGAAGGGAGGGTAGPNGTMVRPGGSPADNTGGYGNPGATGQSTGTMAPDGTNRMPEKRTRSGSHSTSPDDNGMNTPDTQQGR